jgi:hypothetical protein
MIKKKIHTFLKIIAIYLTFSVLFVELGYSYLGFQKHIDYSDIRTADEYGLTSTELYITTSDNVNIHIYEVNIESPKGVIIMLSGITGPSVTHFYGQAKLVSEVGFSSILVDARGHGKSDGNKVTLGIDDVKDVQAVVNYINSSAKYDNTSLRSVAHIEKGNTLSSSDVEEGNITVIAGGQTSTYNHNKSNYKGNIITVSASGAYAGYVWYHDYPIYATDCCVIFSKDESIFITKYLFEVLKLQQNGIYRSQTGAAQPHVYASDLQMLNIPVVSIKKQKEIVDYIANIRTRAKALQAEGKAILEDAKRKVEEMIIGKKI